ncbi:MAG: hypothetical protein Q9181_005959 [Wetmoreana brouardii]
MAQVSDRKAEVHPTSATSKPFCNTSVSPLLGYLSALPITSLKPQSPSLKLVKMTELSFAKSFLSTLDSRPIKLQSDHAADLKTVELKGPYTLPRYPSSPPMRPPTSSTSHSTTSQPPSTSTISAQQQDINITLKSLRNPPLTLSLSKPSSITIYDLKKEVARELGQEGTEGIKLLWHRKPVSDAKTVAEVVGAEEGKGVEFGVMVMGGGGGGGGDAARSAETEAKGEGGGDVQMGGVEDTAREKGGGREMPAAQGASGEEVVQSAAFWDDLKGWLMQRVRDEGVAEEVWSLFKRGWDER